MSGFVSIGQLARECGVSRTTVLYYEQVGLLTPAARSDAGYRRYGEGELARLRQVCAYRATGMSLEAIKRLLDSGEAHGVIAQRLDEIHSEMGRLREQQAVLVKLLGGDMPAAMDKEGWTALLRSSGLDDAAMERWHALFEQQNPGAHQVFLESLGLSAVDIRRIRML
jgi:DNA-binding transcriptional MerR regulator